MKFDLEFERKGISKDRVVIQCKKTFKEVSYQNSVGMGYEFARIAREVMSLSFMKFDIRMKEVRSQNSGR